MNIQALHTLTESIEGFLSQNGKDLREGEVLFHLARSLSKGSVAVEIGSWKGKSTAWLGKGIEASEQQGTVLYAIDPHTGSPEHQKEGKAVWTFPEFEQNIAKAQLQAVIRPLTVGSVEGAGHVAEAIDFIFIDGAHDYESVKEDFETWFPKVKVGGIVAFHDSFIGWSGVEKVVNRELFFSRNFKCVRYINSITYAIKVERASFFERLENFITYGIKKIHMWSLHFPQPFKSFTKKLVWRPFQRSWLKKLSDV
ncbi:MAG: hypothetical protein S4CHLAM123_12090 [Chlamydiales bacterium]|nr:hypothetical protein [Chlamydiales bacterium]